MQDGQGGNENPQQKVLKQEPQKTKPDENESWHDVFPKLGLTGMAAELARHCVMDNQEKGNVRLILYVSGEQLRTEATEKQLHDALERYFSTNIRLDIALQQPSNQSSQIETPAQKAQREGEERQQLAEQEIINDPFVVFLQKQFDARIVKGSIKPRT